MAEKRGAILWAGATTLVGFASLATAGPGPVRTLGVASAMGILILTIAALTLLPALLQLFPGSRGHATTATGGASSEGRGANPFDRFFGGVGRRTAELATRHSRAVTLCLLVSGLVAAAGWGRLQIESNALRYLSDEHPVRQSTEKLEGHGLGSGNLEVMVGASPCDEADRYDRTPRLAELARVKGESKA